MSVYNSQSLGILNAKDERLLGKLINVTLYPHQQTLLSALIDAENSQMRYCDKFTHKYFTCKLLFASNNIYFIDKLGSGKTFVVCALLQENRFLEYQSFNFTANTQINYFENNVICCNIIIVTENSFQYWFTLLRKITTLNIFCLNNLNTLNEFRKIFKSKAFEKINVLLISNKCYLHENNSLHILEHIYLLSKDYVWTRVIYDNFNLLNLNYELVCLSSFVNLFICSNFAEKKPTVLQIDNGVVDTMDNFFGFFKRNLYFLNCIDKMNAFTLTTDYLFLNESLNLPFYLIYELKINKRYKENINLLSFDKLLSLLKFDVCEISMNPLTIEAFSVLDIFNKIDLPQNKFDKLKRNIEDCECSICKMDLVENSIILKCCLIIICETCIIKGCKLAYVKETSLIKGSCPMCLNKLYLNDCVLLKKEFDITKIVSNDIGYVSPSTPKTPEYVLHDKIKQIKKILFGCISKKAKLVTLPYCEIIQGNIRVETVALKKILIFAEHDETLLYISKLLNIENISDKQVILLNSLTYENIDFSFATHIIFWHEHENKTIKYKAIGSAQRAGRTISNLEIITFI